MLEVFTDGSTRPTNPGHSGFGAVIYRDDVELGGASGYLGDNITNNQAEYCGMIAGLKLAAELSVKTEPVVIYSDSMVVLNQLKGTWSQNSMTLRILWNESNHYLSLLQRDKCLHPFVVQERYSHWLQRMSASK